MGVVSLKERKTRQGRHAITMLHCLESTGTYESLILQHKRIPREGRHRRGAHLSQDIRSLLPAHDRNFCVGPHVQESRRKSAAAHAVVSRSVAAPNDACYLGHFSARNSGYKLRSVFGNALVFVSLSNLFFTQTAFFRECRTGRETRISCSHS